MAKIYTKTGDKGTSGLVGGTRVSKSDPRLRAYGEIDELNSCLGVLISQAGDLLPEADKQILHDTQAGLFVIGSHLACEPEKVEQFKLPPLKSEIVQSLEQRIDQLQEMLPPLKNFILPGGNKAASFAHLARTICRRSERTMVHLSENQSVDADFIVLVNRLSDYLFVLARSLNHYAGTTEEIWKA